MHLRRITAVLRAALQSICPSRSVTDPVEMKLLPHSIHLALKTRQATLQWDELGALLADTDWAPYGMNLALKALQDRPADRDTLLRAYVTCLLGGGTAADLQPMVAAVPEPPESPIAAAKLYQVNRTGPATFRRQFEDFLEPLQSDTVAILAHTSLLALPKLCHSGARPFLILYPAACAGTVDPQVMIGHIVRPDQPEDPIRAVSLADDIRSLLGTSSMTLVDDTSNTGETFRRTAEALAQGAAWPTVSGSRALVQAALQRL